jgi:hypothetical protein
LFVTAGCDLSSAAPTWNAPPASLFVGQGREQQNILEAPMTEGTSRWLLMLAAAGGLMLCAAPSVALPHRHIDSTAAHTPTQPSGYANDAGGAYDYANDHRGECWVPTDGGMNPNANFGYWGSCKITGSLPGR